MSAATEYSALETRLLAAMRADLSDADFYALALAVHEFQLRWNAPYAKWCAGFSAPKTWREIPAVPQAMFKAFRISCFPAEETPVTFLTSGTTGETRGAHHLRDTRLYHASALAGWNRLARPQHRAVFLTQSPADAPHSSLASMFGFFAAENGGVFLCDASGKLDFPRLLTLLESGEPVAIFGTALAFLHVFECMGSLRLRLPSGSYALETGGFKGIAREISKAELYSRFEHHLGIAAGNVINEYGMCELSSQFYSCGLGGLHSSGPWVRTLVFSPDGKNEVAIGETGVLRIFDLANLGSSLAIQTGDLAIRRESGFELLGRSPAESPRGCSRMADAQMRGTADISKAKEPPVISMRIEAIAAAARRFDFLGDYSADALRNWIVGELGHLDALDRFVSVAGQMSRALAPRKIVHILSGNTPAAALQSLIRGLLLGAHNLCKLPASGLPEVADFLAALPLELQSLVECSTALPDDWIPAADTVIVFGSDSTIAHFRTLVSAEKTFIGYGHKVSFGMIFDDPDFSSAAVAALDASLFDQLGCLSPHVFYVGGNARGFAEHLAAEMAKIGQSNPRRNLSLADAARVQALLTETDFRRANGADCAALESPDSLVVYDSAPGFPSTPLHRVIFVKPLNEQTFVELEGIREHASACGIFPLTAENAAIASRFGVSRVCAVGKMQSPPAAWRHDGQPSLSRLVRWTDFEA